MTVNIDMVEDNKIILFICFVCLILIKQEFKLIME